MRPIDWYMEGVEFSNCNCDYACPCQFEASLPTQGQCRGFAAVLIDKGRFGDVTLDGLGGALLYAWPGPIYKGGGECQAVIDVRADARQREALSAILLGGETDAGATHWWVYRTMSKTVHPSLFAPIEFDVDVGRRRARISIPGILESSARPIQSPATGNEHRVRIDLPNGIEFELAEVGSGTTKTTAGVALDLKDTYCHFTRLRQSGRGFVRSRPVSS